MHQAQCIRLNVSPTGTETGWDSCLPTAGLPIRVWWPAHWSRLVLSCFVLSCLVSLVNVSFTKSGTEDYWSGLAWPGLALPCLALPCLVWSGLVLSCLVLSLWLTSVSLKVVLRPSGCGITALVEFKVFDSSSPPFLYCYIDIDIYMRGEFSSAGEA